MIIVLLSYYSHELIIFWDDVVYKISFQILLHAFVVIPAKASTPHYLSREHKIQSTIKGGIIHMYLMTCNVCHGKWTVLMKSILELETIYYHSYILRLFIISRSWNGFLDRLSMWDHLFTHGISNTHACCPSEIRRGTLNRLFF